MAFALHRYVFQDGSYAFTTYATSIAGAFRKIRDKEPDITFSRDLLVRDRASKERYRLLNEQVSEAFSLCGNRRQGILQQYLELARERRSTITVTRIDIGVQPEQSQTVQAQSIAEALAIWLNAKARIGGYNWRSLKELRASDGSEQYVLDQQGVYELVDEQISVLSEIGHRPTCEISAETWARMADAVAAHWQRFDPSAEKQAGQDGGQTLADPEPALEPELAGLEALLDRQPQLRSLFEAGEDLGR